MVMAAPRKPLFSMRRPGAERPARVRHWHAVEIQCDRDACAAARAAKGSRYLATEAPLLPLADCNRRRNCSCRYRHFDDRRIGPRRSAEGAPPAPPQTGRADRRCKGGRRLDDHADAAFDGLGPERNTSGEDTYYNYVNRSKLTNPSQ